MNELLPCPFCGGEAETWDGAGLWHVVCTKCGTIGSPCLSEAEAIAAWNSRAEKELVLDLYADLMEYGCTPNAHRANYKPRFEALGIEVDDDV